MNKEYAKYLLEEIKKNYNLIAEEFSTKRERVWEEIRFLFDDYLMPGEKVLDLGCGNGRYFPLFKEKNVDYFGVDYSEELIKIAREKYPQGKFQVGDALSLPYPQNFFDKVYSIAVLHHIPSEEFRSQFLKETRRVLKSGGFLILTVWNLWPRFFNFIFKFALLKVIGKSKLDFKDILKPAYNITQIYFHCFTQKELEGLVKKEGLQIKRSGEIKIKGQSNFYIIVEK